MGCRSWEKLKVNYRRGLWSPEEDQRLRDYILKHGYGCWSTVPAKAGLQRNGKSCRLRWLNYLRPGLKRGMFARDEEEMIMKLHATLGNKWSQIAIQLPGRTDNEVKNYWNSYLKKRVNPSFATSTKTTDSANQVSEINQFALEPNNQILDSESYLVSLGLSTSYNVHEGSSISERPTQVASLPKVIFADWLSHTDHVSGETSCHLDSRSPKNEVFQLGSLEVNNQSNGDSLHGFGDSNTSGGFLSQFQTEGQLQGVGFVVLLSMPVGEIFVNLDINHDITF